ncbi:hypothetical protein CC86DRAFT_413103 [Ophiobolus disseminans]|uniref:Uncharacterized protein n=1 Tax=Ophiobolus disseminans TaxID=1469910 RepID=A0A6A6ZFB9_9PLEO|nr:hypothetical protein CC86DRAFT_413103 [Ophiobolus disseminans]
MSSDYGSDILSDDIIAIEDTQIDVGTRRAPAATPRAPLKRRDANVIATPPPSQSRKGEKSIVCCCSSSNTLPSHPKHRALPDQGVANVPPGRYTTYQSPPSSSQYPPTPVTTRTLPHSQYAPPSSQPTPSKRLREAREPQNSPSTYPRQSPPREASSLQPTPLSPYSTPASQHVPSSSQPTPTKNFTETRLSRVLPSTQLLQSYRMPPSSQPIPSRRPSQPPLYRFPFGTHRGKTLLEVPENYIAYLRVDQDMAGCMPGFDVVLRLFDDGQPPIAPPPIMPPPSPPSIEPTQTLAPSSSAPARVSVSQPVSIHEVSPSTPSSQGEYRFDFGKHIGKTLTEVPPDYISFLKQKGIVENKPALAVAVIEYERQASARCTTSQPASANVTLKFGKHIGKTLQEVPSDYLAWLKSSSIYTDSQALQDAFALYERTQRLTHTPSSSKRKRTSVATSSGNSKRRYATSQRTRIW